MKNPELYHKAVDILVAAYFNDTLRHFDCQACAVGNIICGNLGVKPKNSHDAVYGSTYVFWGYIPVGDYKKEVSIEHITGYQLPDILRIEKAFEDAPRGQARMSLCSTA